MLNPPTFPPMARLDNLFLGNPYEKNILFFSRYVVQEKIRPCFNPLVLTMGLYSALSTTELLITVW